MNKICLVSITASHYREEIYRLMDETFGCDFIFGRDDTSVKQMNISLLRHAVYMPNKYVGDTNVYSQKGTFAKTRKYNVIINDLGIMCLTAWLILLMAKLRGQKVYNWDHGWYGRETMLKKILKRMYFGLADGAFIYGNYARNLMIDNGFEAKKLHVIHNSLDYDRQLAIRQQLHETDIYHEHFGNDNKTILFIGRLTAVKCLDLLVSAFSKLNNEGKTYNLVIVGDGEMKEKLIGQAEKQGVMNRIWFYGACYDEVKNAELIYNADVCVSPGNVGLTAMHTMMYGCPVITHDDLKWQMPEFEAVHKGRTGVFFSRGDVSSLANAIDGWFLSDHYNRYEIRKACYNEIDKEWNPHRQIEIMKEVING